MIFFSLSCVTDFRHKTIIRRMVSVNFSSGTPEHPTSELQIYFLFMLMSHLKFVNIYVNPKETAREPHTH